MITAKDNPTVKQAVKIMSSSKARRKEQLFGAEGLRLCRDVVQNNGQVQTAFFTPAFEEEFGDTARLIAQNARRVVTVSPEVMKKLADTETPQGVLCLCQMPAFDRLPQQKGRYLILENVADPANLGAVARTAEALGLNGLLVSGGCDVYHPKALRASMGALLRLPVYSAGMDEIFACMQALSVPIFGAVVSGANHKAGQLAFGDACGVVIGNEAGGLTQETVARCTGTVTIPMAGRAESLNAAAAACILMWEMTQRGNL